MDPQISLIITYTVLASFLTSIIYVMSRIEGEQMGVMSTFFTFGFIFVGCLIGRSGANPHFIVTQIMLPMAAMLLVFLPLLLGAIHLVFCASRRYSRWKKARAKG